MRNPTRHAGLRPIGPLWLAESVSLGWERSGVYLALGWPFTLAAIFLPQGAGRALI
jgi:hypothetical protein